MEPAQGWAAPGAQALPPMADWRPAHHRSDSFADPVHFYAYMHPCLLAPRCYL